MPSLPANDWTQSRYPTEDVRTYPPDSLLKLKQVCEIVGMKKSSIYKAIADGEFPPPVKIGKRAVGWLASIIFEWVAKRPSAR